MDNGRVVIVIVIAPVVLMLAWLGAGIAALATGDGAAAVPGFLLGLALVVSGGVLLGLVLRPLPAALRRRSRVAGFGCLGAAGVGLFSAVTLPAVSVALRSGLLAPVFSPLGMALAVVLGTAFLVAGRAADEFMVPARRMRETGPRDPPPG